jgi:hypothetical protein
MGVVHFVRQGGIFTETQEISRATKLFRPVLQLRSKIIVHVRQDSGTTESLEISLVMLISLIAQLRHEIAVQPVRQDGQHTEAT